MNKLAKHILFNNTLLLLDIYCYSHHCILYFHVYNGEQEQQNILLIHAFFANNFHFIFIVNNMTKPNVCVFLFFPFQIIYFPISIYFPLFLIYKNRLIYIHFKRHYLYELKHLQCIFFYFQISSKIILPLEFKFILIFIFFL